MPDKDSIPSPETVAEDAGKAGIVYKGVKGNTMIGSWGTSGQKFNGLIDEVQVWNRAHTEEGIKQSMEDRLTSFSVEARGKLAVTWAHSKRGAGSRQHDVSECRRANLSSI